MKARRILVIEDDAAIRQGIADAVEFAGYATIQAATAEDGLDLALSSECDLVLLDLVLPGREDPPARGGPRRQRPTKGSGSSGSAGLPLGLEILRDVRSSRPALPVIILTARGEESDRVAGLELGADDYVVKPFSVKELLARVDAVLRRSAERPSDVSEVPLEGGWADLARREVRFDDGDRCELSQREAELLEYLARHAGRAISREELLARVWRIDPTGLDTRTIDMTVARLREKLRDDPAEPRLLLTVRGKGYMLAGRGPKA